MSNQANQDEIDLHRDLETARQFNKGFDALPDKVEIDATKAKALRPNPSAKSEKARRPSPKK